MAVINLSNGSQIKTFTPPPKDFDPLTASATDLALYGFPQRPDDPQLLARFNSHFSRVKGRMRYIQPTFTVRPSQRAQAGGIVPGVAGQTIWSGAVVYAPSNDSFKWVQGEWIVSNASVPVSSPTSTYACVSWIGLGNSSLLQAGAGVEFNAGGTPSFFLWHEWTPPGWVTINNLSVNAGDLITVVICTPSGAGSTSSTIYFSNTTSGYSTSYGLSFPTGQGDPPKFLGDQAEWIVERPTFSGTAAQLPDYGQIFFTNAVAGLSNSTVNAGATGGNNGAINIVLNGTTYSTGTVVSQTIVQCQYGGPEPHGNTPSLVVS